MPIEIKHRYTGAVLHTVDADTLSGADLRRADLSGADLTETNLSGANLGGADLSRAYLDRTYLTGANLNGATIDTDRLHRLLARATRLDGHEFFLFALQEGSPKIMAGCRWMTIAEYRDHVARMYPNTDKAKETLRILNFFKATAEGL